MGQRKQKEARDRRQTGAEAEFTQYMTGDGATGANTAYGNTAGNQGARLAAAGPDEDRTGDR